jgi:hypothetical protein
MPFSLASLYPANTVLLRKGRFSVRDKGHTEAWEVNGPVATLSAKIIHDDWKTTGASQYPNELGLSKGRHLEVQATDGSGGV